MARHRVGPPAAARAKLVRPRLLDRLRRRWLTPVTVVSAPAGYGKTTLLAQAVAANAAAPLGLDLWLTCPPGDGTASVLGEGLGLAVGAPGAVVRGRLDAGGYAAAVTEAMWRRSPQHVALIVDDVHEIPAGSPAAELLAQVAASLPGNGHLVLAGRGAPPVPLARLDLEGRVVHVGETDLAFTDDEVDQFAALRGVARAQVAGCGGWPALAELSASSSERVTADYVGQEVLGGMPPPRRRNLAMLAQLGTFDPDLARAVLGPGVAVADVVDALPLVTQLPGGDLSLHSLWQTLLADELTAAELVGIRRRAAAALRRDGQPAAAVRLLLDAEAWDDVTDAIVDVLGAGHAPVPLDLLAHWLDRLPPAQRRQPGGRLLAGATAAQSDPAGAWEWLQEAAAAFHRLGHLDGELACAVQLGQLAWWSEDPLRLAQVALRLFELESAGCEEARPLACLGRALVVDVQNDSRQVLAELDRIPPGSLNDVWQGVVSWFRSISHMHLGDASAAQQAAEQALGFSGPLHLLLADGAHLQARWFEGDVTAVREALPDLVDRMAAAGHRNYTALAAAQCCIATAHHGDVERATEHLQRARAAALDPETPLVGTNLALAETALAVAAGDEARAAAVLTRLLAEHPLGQGHSAAPQQRSLALLYVLVPATRPVWDAAELGPTFALARDLARALVAVREQGRLPAEVRDLPAGGVVEAHLPLRWSAELALAAVAAGRDGGWQVLDFGWPAARPAVDDLAGTARGSLRSAARTALRTLAVPPSGRFELRLLGPIELWRDGTAVGLPEWRRERVRLLLAYLALHRRVSRPRLADDLWPTLGGDAQSRNMRVNLTHLLRVLEPDRAPRAASYFVRQEADRLTLHAHEHLDVDLWRFDEEAERAAGADRAGAPPATLDHALRAVELWRGEPAELVSHPWAVAPLEQRRARFAALATRAGELLLAQGSAGSAHALAERALEVDPWMEAAHRLVVAAHRDQGDVVAARRSLARYRDAIREIGLDPGEATLMVERLLGDEA